MEADWIAEFKENCLYRVDESLRMLEICLERTPEEEFWIRPNPASNSIGHLLLHLSGNLRQYVISSLGGHPDTRQRDHEFAPEEKISAGAVRDAFRATASEARSVIRDIPEAELLRRRNVQGFRFSGLGIIIHAVEHLSYHTGQIAYIIKARQGRDLGFYDGVELNAKNE